MLGLVFARIEIGWLVIPLSILALMGFDHEKLTYRYNGRDFRLTDVAGKVVKSVIA